MVGRQYITGGIGYRAECRRGLQLRSSLGSFHDNIFSLNIRAFGRRQVHSLAPNSPRVGPQYALPAPRCRLSAGGRRKLANGFGLSDVVGNVYELVWEPFGAYPWALSHCNDYGRVG